MNRATDPMKHECNSNSAELSNAGDRNTSTRFDGLDGVRAAAMLLGVFYHLPISMYQGGGFGFGGFGASASPKQAIDDWLHSFRMPLFFLISGFFANMMLRKYGWRQFLFRRWWRIGAPFLVSLFALAGFRIAVAYFQPANVSPFGMPAFGPPAAAGTNVGPAAQPPAIPGFGTALSGNDAARNNSVPSPFGPFAGPPPGQSEPSAFGPPGLGLPQRFGPPGNPPAGALPVFKMPEFPSRAWSESLLGKQSRHFSLEHLWFLWYLLVFVSIGPVIVLILSKLFGLVGHDALDQWGRLLFRYNAAGLVFGLASVPFLLHARNFMGWSLANPHGFMGAFPDFLVQYYPDQPFYLLYFIAGWLLFRLNSCLPELASKWLWNLSLGVVAFAVSRHLSTTHSFRPETDKTYWIRLGTFTLYAIGSACSTCGFIGFFVRFLDYPTRIGRYFADTALWIYLIHLPLIPYLIWWAQPSSGPWWTGSLAGMVVVTGISLVLFELFVRPTPLNYLYGPPSATKKLDRGKS